MQAFHEYFTPDGQPRLHQATLGTFLSQNQARFDGIVAGLEQRLLEQEVSYNLLGNPDGSARPWQLDPLPHLLPETEFSTLAAGLRERANLLNLCLQDFYGPQNLIKTGVVPPAIVLGNPHFFRGLHGFNPAGNARLLLYAADVVKTEAGLYQVQSDRTAAPTGSGYALENRLAIGHSLGEAFQNCRVRKINRFFEEMRRTLENLAPSGSSIPRVVVLTPGTHDESSFEHGYLARYQGFELVEGRDLTVRGDEVYLKTLEGLKQVDVILRRLTDDYCDPLELRLDSYLGVSGLVTAARARTVALANPLGSGLIESPLFRAYLPKMAQALLGKQLLLPSIPTRHLGNEAHFNEVFASFDDWLIRSAFVERRTPAKAMGELSQEERETWRARIQKNPQHFVAEKWPEPSLVPIGLNLERSGKLTSRLFACHTGSDYLVMPGGLGRVNDSPDGMFIDSQTQTTKDIWVLGTESDLAPALPQMPESPVELRRGGIDLPSRLFDDIFWLGRYVERANSSARLIRAGLEPVLAENRSVPRNLARRILQTLATLQTLAPLTGKEHSFESRLLAGIYNPNRDNSVLSCLKRIDFLTTRTRSRLSGDAWSILRKMAHLYQPAPQTTVGSAAAVDKLDDLLLYINAFHGVTSSNMVRGNAWMFLEMGRRIEQGVFVFSLLGHLFEVGGGRILMETLLKVCDSLLTYRARYLSNLQAAPVVDLVLTDDTNPQSVIYQVRSLLRCVRALPRERAFPLSRAEQRLVGLETALVTADLEKVCKPGSDSLKDLAEHGINLLWQVSDDLSQTYFNHATAPRTNTGASWVEESL